MEQLEGTVKWFSNAKGYGFLGRNDGGADVFVHYSSIQQPEGYKSLKEGEPVSFQIITGKQGPQADNVNRLGQRPVMSTPGTEAVSVQPTLAQRTSFEAA